MNLRNKHQPSSLIGLKGEELATAALKWKVVESSCIASILQEMETSFLPKLEGANFEDGIVIQGVYDLNFKPNRHLVEYYQLIECSLGLIFSTFDVHMCGRL